MQEARGGGQGLAPPEVGLCPAVGTMEGFGAGKGRTQTSTIGIGCPAPGYLAGLENRGWPLGVLSYPHIRPLPWG